MPDKKETPKLMDVAKPGKSAPAPTSKPVIIGHKPMIKDPMVNEGKPSADTSSGQKITVTRGEKRVIPLSAPEVKPEETKKDDARAAVVEETTVDDKKDTKTVVAAKALVEDENELPKPEALTLTPAKTEESADKSPAGEDSAKTDDANEESSTEPKEEDTSKPDETAEETEKSEESDDATVKSDDSAVVDAVAEQAGNKKKKAEPSEEEKKKNADIEKLIEEKKYFVPMGQVTKKRRNRWALVWLLLIIVLAALYAIDAELIDTGIELPFDIIKV